MKQKRALRVTALTIFFGLAVAAGSSGRVSLPPMADLTFGRGTYDTKSLRVRLYLINKGAVATTDCTVTLKATKTKKGTTNWETVEFDQALPGLQPGARLTMIFDLPNSSEFLFSPAYANADSKNVVTESNEQNNQWMFLKIGGSANAPTPTPKP